MHVADVDGNHQRLERHTVIGRTRTGQPLRRQLDPVGLDVIEHILCRVEAATLMLQQGRHPIETIADETGFADRERMRLAFLRAYGQPPQVIRRGAHTGALS